MAVKLEELTAQNQKIESQNQELNERLAKLEASLPLNNNLSYL